MMLRRALLAAVLSTISLLQSAIAEDARKPVCIANAHLIVVKKADSNTYLAYSELSGEWRSHVFPEGIEVQPVLEGEVCVFNLSGKGIKEIVAVDRKGEWCVFPLPRPTDSGCTPVVARSVAACVIDGRAYAFSAVLGTWDVVEMPAPPIVSADMAQIVTREGIAVFSAEIGKWAVANLEVNVENPGFLGTESLMVIKMLDSNTFLAYSKYSGKWTKHAFAECVTLVPVASDDVCVFGLSGEGIEELVAVDRQGKWCTVRLPKPTTPKCTPIVGDSVAGCTVDGRAYAFSALLGKWDVVEIDSPVGVSSDRVDIVTPDRVAAFSAETGRWAVAELNGNDEQFTLR